MEILLYILIGIATWFVWSIFHEMSHVVAAKLLGNVEWWKIKLLPHKYNGKFYFARSYWAYKDGLPTVNKQGMILLAPRVLNVLSTLTAITLMGTAFASFGHTAFMIMLLGGTVDLLVGSLGLTEQSDLRVASEKFNVTPWVGRMFGFMLTLGAVLALVLSI